jgi:DNA-binding transcriptional LysR family regulator
MDVRQLKAFVAVAEEGSIHAGARRLMIAQPAVSTTLRRLERELRTRLVTRSPRGVELTRAGREFYARADELVRRFDDLALVQERSTHASRRLRVGLLCGVVAAGELTAPIVMAFRHRHPRYDVELIDLTIGDHVDALRDGRVDVAIVRPPYFAEPIDTVPLFAEPIVLCVNQASNLGDATSLRIDDLLDEPFVRLVNAPPRWMDFWHLAPQRATDGPTRPDPAVTLAALQLTLLCEQVSQPVAGSAWRYGMASPLLRSIPITDAPASMVAVGRRHGERRPDIDAFTTCAREVCAGMIELVPNATAA